MLKRIQDLEHEIDAIVINNGAEAESFRLAYLSKKGKVSVLFDEFKTLEGEEKRTVGKGLNLLKRKAEEKWSAAHESNDSNLEVDYDASLLQQIPYGSLHPLKVVEDELVGIFSKLGFDLAEGPEIEDDHHNFGALNFADDHPARDMQDTFFIAEHVLRTHTSSVQVREMERGQPPFRLVMPGRVYRNEAVSSRSNCFFHQIEGLYVDEGVSFTDLKQTLYYFVQQFFGEGTQIRFRSSYFPFTEPSAEMDIWAGLDTEENRRLTKGTGWLEVLGCGMVHPNVLESCGLDAKKFSGFAFGMGIDRLTMLKYGISDIRDFFSGDVRMLQQFGGL
ncbi:MAG: phenylalanine--tRNA ligase subunit alpha [Bacteroidetes bacterium]|nr:phenylalanine--tRNA ligase subunit alpha [Bacteroidota bacterium]